MAIALRSLGDEIPELTPLPRLTVRRETDAARMAQLQRKGAEEMQRRFARGHRAYVGWWNDAPVAWGWVATREAEIGELRIAFEIAARERYLWNFVTIATHRGLGIYPRLLNEIVRIESREAERFWIAYAPENRASGSGIRKAGFATVAELSFDDQGRPAVQGAHADDDVAARMLGVVQASAVSSCWRCVRAPSATDATCATTTTMSCCCDYQQPEVACVA